MRFYSCKYLKNMYREAIARKRVMKGKRGKEGKWKERGKEGKGER